MPRVFPKRWRLWIAAALCAALLGVLDAHFKSTTALGFRPADAQWTVAATDLLGFAEGVRRTSAWQAVSREVSGPLAELSLHIRKTTGIRPRPLRWRIWMGRRLVASAGPSGSGICVRPGLLLRAADVCFGKPTASGDSAGIRAFGPWRYAWRDGFLIVSEHSEYVTASLAASAFDARVRPGGGLSVTSAALDGEFRIQSEAGFPFEGEMGGRISDAGASLMLAAAWPDSPLLAVTGKSPEDVAAVWWGIGHRLEALVRSDPEFAWMADEGCELVARLREHWSLGALPPEWKEGVAECAGALIDIDRSSAVPIPDAAVVLRTVRPVSGAHPFEAVFKGWESIPYEWGGFSGTMFPCLGERFLLCFAGRDCDWLMTTRESSMERLLRGPLPSDSVRAALAIRLDWRGAAKSTEGLLRYMAEHEMVPGRNGADVEKEIAPFLRAAECLGTLLVDAAPAHGRIAVSGYLARETPSSE